MASQVVINPTDNFPTRAVKIIRQAIDCFGQDKAGRMAMAIAFRTLFSLSPLLLVAVSVAGFFFRREAALEALIAAVSGFLGEAGAEIVQQAVRNTSRTATATGLLGIGLLFWTGSGLFIEARTAINDIFRAPDDAPRGVIAFVWSRITGFLAVLAIGIIVLGLVALNLFVATAQRFVDDRIPWLSGVVPVLIPLLSALLLGVILALHYQWFTIRPIPWRAAWWGGSITAALLVAAALVLGLYIATRGDISAGAFTGGAILVLFLVMALAQAYLLGAEITRVLADTIAAQATPPPAPPPPPRPAPPPPAKTGTLIALVLGLLIGRRLGRKTGTPPPVAPSKR
jgi:membrane protein